MAVIHEERHGDRLYQVRTAGSSVRLYTNGVFHSQYSPSPRAATSMWDLLCMPALLAEHGRPRRVLVLGVGGGALIRFAVERLGARRVVGVELDPVHLSLARRFFGVGGAAVELVAADARRWIRDYRGPPFDLVVDDLFDDGAGEPRRAIAFDEPWLRLLGDAVAPGGVLAANFASLPEYRLSAARSFEDLPLCWTAGHTLRLDTLENVVVALVRGTSTLESFRGAIEGHFGRAALARTSVRNLPGRPHRAGR